MATTKKPNTKNKNKNSRSFTSYEDYINDMLNGSGSKAPTNNGRAFSNYESYLQDMLFGKAAQDTRKAAAGTAPSWVSDRSAQGTPRVDTSFMTKQRNQDLANIQPRTGTTNQGGTVPGRSRKTTVGLDRNDFRSGMKELQAAAEENRKQKSSMYAEKDADNEYPGSGKKWNETEEYNLRKKRMGANGTMQTQKPGTLIPEEKWDYKTRSMMRQALTPGSKAYDIRQVAAGLDGNNQRVKMAPNRNSDGTYEQWTAEDERKYQDWYQKARDYGLMGDSDNLYDWSDGRLRLEIERAGRKAEEQKNFVAGLDIDSDNNLRGAIYSAMGFNPGGGIAVAESWDKTSWIENGKPADYLGRENLYDAALYDRVHGGNTGEYSRILSSGTEEERKAAKEEVDAIWNAIETSADPDEAFEKIRGYSEEARNDAVIGRGRDEEYQIQRMQDELDRREGIRAQEEKAKQYTDGEYREENNKTKLGYNIEEGNGYIHGGSSLDQAYYRINHPFVEYNTTPDKIYQPGDQLKEHKGEVSEYYFLTDAQRETFNKFYNAGDTESAQAYLDGLHHSLMDARAKWMQNFDVRRAADKDTGLLTTVESFLTNPISGAMGTAGSVAALFGNKEAADPNSRWYDFTRSNRDIRATRGQIWGEGLQDLYAYVTGNKDNQTAKKVGNFLYNVFTSMGDMAVSMGLSGGNSGLVQLIMSSEAAASTMLEQLEKGRSPEEASLMSLGSGIIEAVTEKYSIEALFSDPKNLALYLAKNTFTEATEEGASTLLNTLTDEMAAQLWGHRSAIQEDYDNYYNELRKQHVPEEQAKKLAMGETLKAYMSSLGEDMLAGALSGFSMAAIGGTASKASERSQLRGDARGIRKAGNTRTLLEAAAGYKKGGKKYNAVIEEAQRAMEKKGKLSTRQTMKVLREIYGTGNEMMQKVAEEETAQAARDEIAQMAEAQGINISEEDIAKAASGAATLLLEGKVTDTLRAVARQVPQIIDVIGSMNRLDTEAGLRTMARVKGARASTVSLMDTARNAKYSPEEALKRAAEQSAKNVGLIARLSATAAASKMASENLIQENEETGAGNKRGRLIYSTETKDGSTESGSGTILRKEGDNYVIQTADGEKTVSTAEAKAADKVTATVMNFVESTNADDEFATALLETAQTGSVTEENVEATLQGARDALIRGHLGVAMPSGAGTSAEAAAELYKKGAQQAKAAEDQRRQNAKGTILNPGKGKAEYRNVNKEDLSYQQRQQVETMEAVAKKVGFNIIFEYDEKNANRYGEYDSATGSVIINLAGKDRNGLGHHLLVTASHELTHMLEKNSPEAYDQLRKFVFEELGKNGLDVAARVAQKLDNYNYQIAEMRRRAAEAKERGETVENGLENIKDINIDQAIAETVADACDQVLGNEQLIRRMAEENPSLYEKVKNFVADFIAKIRDAVAGMRLSGSIDSLYIRNTDELAKKWGIALEEVSGKTATEQSAEQNEEPREASVEYSFTDVVRDRKTLENNKKDIASMVAVTISGNKFNQGTNTLKNDLIAYYKNRKNMPSHVFGTVNMSNTGIKNSIYHGMAPLKAALYEAVPGVIENGKLVFYGENWDGKKYNSGILAAPVEIKEGELQGKYFAGVIVHSHMDGQNTYYTHDGTAAIIKESDDSVIFTDESDAYPLDTKGRDPESDKDKEHRYMINILKEIALYNSQSGQNGNKQLSLAEMDQEYEDAYNNYDDDAGEELVRRAAEEAMQDSKIRDENGKLKVVYHQTNADPFTVFDIDKARTTSDIQGAYFAPEFDKYHEYGDRTYAVFLNIKNPAINPEGPDLRKTGDGARVMKDLIAKGYDGIINLDEDGKPYEYVAFYPDQIKSAEAFTEDDSGDLIPLSERFNSWKKDIRFSLGDQLTEETLKEAEQESGYQSESLAKASVAVNKDGERIFSMASMDHDKELYRQMLVDSGILKDEEIEKLFRTIDRTMSIIDKDRTILDMNETYGKDERSFLPVKPNSDPLYQVSLDFSTLCRKRLLQQALQEMIEKKHKTVMTKAERVAMRNALVQLQKEGKRIEIACALCYVESARLKSPEQIRKFMGDKRGYIVDYLSKSKKDYKAKIDAAEAAMKESFGYDAKTSLKEIKKKNSAHERAIRAMKRKMYQEYKPNAQEESIIQAAESMDESMYKTASGLARLKRDYPLIFDAFTTSVRNATKSKGIEEDTPFYAGDTKSISDELIERMNKENGLRSQSWSDFQTYHILDYMGAIIELSTRKAKMQAYTKFPDYIRLMGQTGQMINASLIPADYDGKALAYDPKEGMDYDTAQALREQYPDTVGNICIGISDDHIRALLGSDDIDYVIPYHKSSMDKETRRRIGLRNWSEYESQQNEKEKDFENTDKNGKNYHKKPDFSDWFDYKTASQMAEAFEATGMSAWEASKLAMQEMANRYIELCHERGLQEKFANFSGEDGYWKLLIDRKMINQITGKLIEQQAVKPIFDGDVIESILKNEVQQVRETQPDIDEAKAEILRQWENGDIQRAAKSKEVKEAMKAADDRMIMSSIVETFRDEEPEKKLEQTPTQQAEAAEEKANDSAFSFAEGGADANDWIMGLDPSDLTSDSLGIFNTKGVKTMIREYQKLTRDMQATQEKMAELRKTRDEARGDEQRKARINLQTEQNKLDRMQKRINEISEGKDFKSLMQRAQNTIDAFLRGKTQAEVEISVRKMKTEAKQMRETAEQAAKNLEQLASREDAVIAHRFFDSKKLTDAAKAIQGRFNGRGDTGIIEDRIGSIGLKVFSGDGEGAQEEIQELVDYMIDADWATFRFGMFGGQRFEARDIDQSIRNDMADAIMEQVFQVLPDMNANPAMKNEAESLISYVNSITKNTRQTARGMARVAELAQGMQEQGDRLAKAAATMKGDLQRAIRYFDELNAKNKAAVNAEQMEEIIRTLESKAAQQVLDEQNKWAKKIEADRNLRELTTEKQNLRKKINTAYNRVAKLILQESDQKNIPENLKPVARAAIRMILDNDAGGMKKITGVDWQALQNSKKTMDLIDQRDGTNLNLKNILDADGGDDVQIAIQEALDNIREGIDFYSGGGKGRTQATLEGDKAALEKIQKGMSTIYDIVDRSRKIFVEGKLIDTANAAYEVDTEAKKKEVYREWVGSMGKAVRGAKNITVLENTTPEYFFKNMKNNGLSRIYNEFKNGEDRYGRIMLRTKRKVEQIAEKTGYETWDTEELHKIKLESGKTVSLTLEQMMSLWATWNRENTLGPEMSQHLLQGGFVYEEESAHKILGREAREQKPNRVTAEDMKQIGDMLTAEQKAYVDGMVRILSRDMSEIGNEASMRMFGIEKYKETYYFPFAVWDGVKNKASNAGSQVNPTNNNRAANFSWTNRRVNNASSAIYLFDFSQVCAEHINQMATYTTMAQAIEGMNRVLNFRVLEGADNPTTASERNVESILTERYGKDMVKYIRQFMLDLNGGVSQQGSDAGQMLMSLFKKNAVGGSLSVAFQQPLSYIRASTMISPADLAAALNPAYYKGSYEEMLEHSGVAVIKDMGKFDMNFSRGATEWLMPEAKKKGLKKAYSEIEKKTNKLPEIMDQMTWTRMWSAIKIEQHRVHPEMDMKSDEFLDMVGKRFNDVMRKTQVYDSILVKSQLMRRNNFFTNSVTAFRGEPTLTLNLIMDALQNINEEGGKKKLAAVLASYLLTAIGSAVVKGIMGAGRSPDDKKTLAENFAYKFANSFIGEANPLSLIPGYDNIIDLLSGNDVNDNAWGMIKTMATSLQKIWNPPTGEDLDAMSGYRYLEDTVGQITQLFSGVPAKNLMRDTRAIYNWFGGDYADRAKLVQGEDGQMHLQPGRKTSGAVLKYQLIDQVTSTDLLGAINGWMDNAIWDKGTNAYYNRIYEAERDGRQQDADAMKEYLIQGKGKAEGTVAGGVASAAKKDESRSAAETADWMLDSGYTDSTSWITTQFKEGNISEDELRKLYKEHFPDKDPDAAIWNFWQTEWKEGRISEKQMQEKYVKYHEGKDQEDAEKYLQDSRWNEYKEKFEKGKITEKQAMDYYRQTHPKAKDQDVLNYFWSDYKDQYKKGKLSRDEAKANYKKYHPKATEAETYWAMDELDYAKEHKSSEGYSKYARFDKAVADRSLSGVRAATKELIKYGTTKDPKETLKKSVSSYVKPLYMAAAAGSRDEVSILNLANAALDEAGYTEKERNKYFALWKKDKKKQK